MSQSTSTTTIALPHSLTSTTPSLPTPTQRALITHLRATNSISELSNILADSLARTGWTDRVRALALELLRNGSCDTFPELMEEVMRRAKLPRDTNATSSAGAGAASKEGNSANGVQTNGTNTPTASQGGGGGQSALPPGVPGQGSIVVSKEWSGGPDGLPDVRIPLATVDAGAEYLRERIKDVVEVQDDN